MTHHAAPSSWDAFNALDEASQRTARDAFGMMKADPRHPGIHLKKIGRYWSARVGHSYRAVAVDSPDGLLWIWIGHHDPYERKLGG